MTPYTGWSRALRTGSLRVFTTALRRSRSSTFTRRRVMEKNKRGDVMLAAFMFAGAISTFAQHSFSATYVIEEKITLEGKELQMMMRNPHSCIHGEVIN